MKDKIEIAFEWITTAILIALLTLLMLSAMGCSTYYNSREKGEEKERTFINATFQKLQAEAIASRTRSNTNGYSRDVGVGALKLKGDPETIRATGEAIGKGGKAFIAP